MLFQVIPRVLNTGRLTLHPKAAQRLGCARQKVGFLRFGERSRPVEIMVSDEVGEAELWLGLETVEQLALPLCCRYELCRGQNELRIGPLIGIAAASTQENLQSIVHRLSNYVYDDPAIGGAVLAFALDGVDTQMRQISGFLYNPETQEWEQAVCGYPGAVFKRVGMSEQMRAHFQEALGHRVFNETIFDKWEMHEWLSGFPEAAHYLPESRLYQGARDVWKLLRRHGQVFLKPIRGSQGHGVVRVRQGEQSLLVEYEQNGVQQATEWLDKEQGAAFLDGMAERGRYLVQQGLELVKHEQKVIDFRLIVVKNRFGEWEHMGAIARHGTAGHIVSNISRGGTAEMAEVTLANLLGLEQDAVYRRMGEMAEAALTAARCLEESGVHAGNLGVDLALDTAGNLWILEINNLDPNHTIALDAGNRQLFYQVKRENMLYAKRLAGFGERSERV